MKHKKSRHTGNCVSRLSQFVHCLLGVDHCEGAQNEGECPDPADRVGMLLPEPLDVNIGLPDLIKNLGQGFIPPAKPNRGSH